MARDSLQTASPQRNFTLTTAERIQAIVAGLPAWARRRRRIEDLPALILAAHQDGRPREVKKCFAELLELIDAHNRYYPMEANLPFDPTTSRVMDGGEPWRPMPRPTLESILAPPPPEEAPVSAAIVWSGDADEATVSFVDVHEHRFTVRLSPSALTCSDRLGELVRLSIDGIAEVVPTADTLDVVMQDATTIHLPFRLSEAAHASLAQELNARLRTLRATTTNYRGA